MRTEGGAPASETPPETQQAPAEGQSAQTETGPPEWLAPITERLNEVHSQSQQLADQLAGLYQEPEGEEDEDDFELYDAETGDLTPEGAQRIIDERVEARLTEHLSERDQAAALEQREDAFDALREEIPELQDDKLATALVNEVAEQLHANGLEAAIDTPAFVDFVENAFYASRWREHQRSESQEQREVVLEGAGGAHQAQRKSDEVDWGERIQKAAERLRPSI